MIRNTSKITLGPNYKLTTPEVTLKTTSYILSLLWLTSLSSILLQSERLTMKIT